MKTTKLKEIKRVLENGLTKGVYPGAVLLVASKGKTVLFDSVGFAALQPRSFTMKKGMIFDLASLTKPLGTSLAMMKMVEDGTVELDEPIAAILGDSVPKDKKGITSRLLLSHASGLPDWVPFFSIVKNESPDKSKEQVRNLILETPLTCTPGKKTCYSDLGFMLLEWIVEKRTGLPLARFLKEQFYAPLGLSHTFFYRREMGTPYGKEKFAATEACKWRKKTLQGVVHDENAYAMGGYSGHAGLFGTAREVNEIACFLLSTHLEKRKDLLDPKTLGIFFTMQKKPENTTWALGWDTPSMENSSAGKHFSKRSVGHLGFTGTSLWMDLEREIVVIFLTNRVHPTRENEKIRAFRPVIHDRIMEALGCN